MLSSQLSIEEKPQLSEISQINSKANELKEFIDLLVKKLEASPFRGELKLSSIVKKLKTISTLCSRLGVIPDEVYQSYISNLNQSPAELLARIPDPSPGQVLNATLNIINRASVPSSSEIQADYLNKVVLSLKLILTGIDGILMEITTARALIDWSTLSNPPQR